MVDALAVHASSSQTLETATSREITIDILYRPSIPDNHDHCQVFKDDEQVERFFTSKDDFANKRIDWDDFTNIFEVVDLGMQEKIPKRLVPIEQIFNRHDMYKYKAESTEPEEYIEVNIGSESSPSVIKIRKCTSRDERSQIERLIREYLDVFTWSYDDLKSYKEDIIQLTIPLKEGTRPFKVEIKEDEPKAPTLDQKGARKDVNC